MSLFNNNCACKLKSFILFGVCLLFDNFASGFKRKLILKHAIMRRSLLTLALLAIVAAASAQPFAAKRATVNPSMSMQVEGVANPSTSASQSLQASKLIEAGNIQRRLGYYVSDTCQLGIGWAAFKGDNQIAAKLDPSDFKAFDGAKVVAVRVCPGGSTTIKGVTIYGLDAEGYIDTIAYKDTSIVSKTYSTSKVFRGQWETIQLPKNQQFNIDGNANGYLVAYTATQTGDNDPFGLWYGGPKRELYAYMNIPEESGGSGEGWYTYGTRYGSVAIQLIVEGNFPENGVVPQDFGMFILRNDSSKTLPVTFSNIGSSLSNYSYTVSFNGTTTAEQTDTISPALGLGGNVTKDFTFTAPSTPGVYPLTITVTKANGTANGAEVATATGTMVATDKNLPRRVVMEELTGTGCGWCPRGLVGMHLARQAYPDNFIGIGIHMFNSAGDNMFNTNYAGLGFTGAPQCMLDRDGNYVDPYYGNRPSILNEIAAHLQGVAEVGVDVKAVYSADSTEVNFTTTLDPLINNDYEVAYVLTADSLHGTTSGWQQLNFYEGRDISDANLVFLGKEAEYYSPYFNDVLIGSSYVGTSNIGPVVTATMNTPMTLTETIDLYNGRYKSEVLEKLHYDQVYAIAIVTNSKTGQIVNAARTRVLTQAEADGISGVTTNNADATPTAIYNAAGQRTAKPSRGLNIIRLSNGKTVKVMKNSL